jgi:hypothetical protein
MKLPEYSWWVKHAHKDSAFLFLIEEPALFAQQVLSRLDKVGRGGESEESKQEVVNQAMWRATFEQDRFGAMTTILEDIHAEPVRMNTLKPVRQIGNAIGDEDGPFLALGVSAFWIPWAYRYDRGQFNRFARWASGAGFRYVRWFGAHNWDGGTPTPEAFPQGRSAYFDLMRSCIEGLAQHGLYSFITFATRREMFSSAEEVYDVGVRWGRLVRECRDSVIGVEMVNEAMHPHNKWNEGAVRNMLSAFRHGNSFEHPIASLTAPSCLESYEDIKHQLVSLYSGSGATAATVHHSRKKTGESPWRWIRQPWHTKHGITPDLTSEGVRLVIDNEPERWDKSTGGRNLAVAVAAPIVSWICGSAMTCHHDNYGVHNKRGEYGGSSAHQQLGEVFRAVLPSLPADLPNWKSVRVGTDDWHPFPNLLEQHWVDAGVEKGINRAYAAVNPRSVGGWTEYVMVLTGVRGSVRLEGRSFRYMALGGPSPGIIKDHSGGPCVLNQSDSEAWLVMSNTGEWS